MREQRTRPHCGADDGIGEQQHRRTHGHAGRERRLHAHLELLRLLRDIGLAADGDTGCGTDDAQIVAFHDAVLDADVAGDFVEGETFAEQIAEVECQAALQRLQREHAEQLAGAGIELGEPSLPRLNAESTRERRIVERLRTSRPRELAMDLRRRAAHRIGQTEAR